MTTIEAILLGIIQGLTEFLPISSSGHLLLAQTLFGLENLRNYILFDLICHLGTLCAIFCLLYAPLKIIVKHDGKKLGQVILGTLPLFPLVLLIKPIKELFDQPQYLGFFFLATAAILWTGIKYGHTSRSTRPWKDALYIGFAQALAILPGISRSGSTISAARLLGWDYHKAIQFSFLLAIPAILGGITLELGRSFFSSTEVISSGVSLLQYVLGFLFSFVSGYFALKLLMNLAAKNQFMYFVWYCLFIGIFTLWYVFRGYSAA